MGKPLADPATVRAERLANLATVAVGIAGRLDAIDRIVDEAECSHQPRFYATLFGAPRTKKNHGKIIHRKVKGEQRKFHVPSEAYQLWCASIVAQLAKAPQMPNAAYNCKAVFYRDADRGDAVGYYQGLADALEAAGLISDDKLIVSWDGSRLRVDRTNPRIQLALTPVED